MQDLSPSGHKHLLYYGDNGLRHPAYVHLQRRQQLMVPSYLQLWGHSCYYFASAPSLPCSSGFKGLGWLHGGEAKDIKWEVNPTSAYTATTTPSGECWPAITMAMTTLDNPSYVPQPLRSYPQPTDNPWYVPTTRNPPRHHFA